MGSGQNEDDAILKAAKHHWAFKKNKNIKVHNNKCVKDGKPNQQKDHVTHEDAPENLNQSAELYPEAVVFLIFAGHPIFQPDISSFQSPTINSSPNEPDPSDNENESVDAEETTFRNRMTSKGFFKSRNIQRAEELQRKNKRSKSNAYNDDVIDLTKEKTAVAKEHVQAARSHVEMMKFQCKLSIIDHAIKVGINVDRLRPCVEKTLHDLFPEVLDGSANRNPYDDSIVNLEKDNDIDSDGEANSTALRRNTMDLGDAHDFTPPPLRCCAGKECVDPSVEFNDEFECMKCDGLAHGFCIGRFDNEGIMCLGCVLPNNGS